MPKLPPTRNSIFNAPYEALSAIKSDGFTLPHLNSSATLAIYPGEPFLKAQGETAIVCLAQSMIEPGEWKSVLRFWNAIFPCDFSADVEDGDNVYWDIDDEVCKLEGDVDNGFLLGSATFSVEPGQRVIADADGRPVVATSTSTHVQVVYQTTPSIVIGTVGEFTEESASE
jgi:hypothetical protein